MEFIPLRQESAFVINSLPSSRTVWVTESTHISGNGSFHVREGCYRADVAIPYEEAIERELTQCTRCETSSPVKKAGKRVAKFYVSESNWRKGKGIYHTSEACCGNDVIRKPVTELKGFHPCGKCCS